MNPLDTLDDRQLQGFFRRSKTEMSCMDKPQSLLKQLRDHELIPEEKYKEMIRIKSKEVMQDNVYELLNWIETERPWDIRLFWICVFKEFIMTQYPTLKRLQDSLRSLPNGENAEIWTLDKYRHHLPVTCGDKQGTLYRDKLAKGEPCILRNNDWYTPCAFQKLSGKGSRSNWKKSIRCNDTTLEKLLKDEHLTCPGYNKSKAKKSTLPCSSNTASLPKGENVEIWMLDKYRHQLPVTCGDEQGTLYRDKLAKGEPCILMSKKWYTPCAFEKLSGKGSHSNWKKSIRCNDTTLEKLLKDEHLTCPGYNKSKAKKSTLPCSSNTASLPKGENVEIWTLDKYRHQLPVTCGAKQGTLYRDKLAKGEPCILRNKKWYTPRAFQKLSGKGSRSNWKKSIRCNETTLEKLLKDGHLTCPGYNKCKAKKSTLPCSSNTVSAVSESEEEMEEEEVEEEELQANPDEEEVSMEDEVELQGNDCSTQNSNTGSFPLSDEESSGEHAREGLSEDKSMGKESGGRDKLGSFCDRDEQQGHSSSQASPRKRKPTFASLPKGENVEIWTWDLYKHLLPVTCGDEEGTLFRDKLAKGEPCILRNNEWYTPCAFQKLSGKGSRSNWKKSIRCNDTTLEKLLKDKHLTCPGYNKSKAKKSTLPCSSNTASLPKGENVEISTLDKYRHQLPVTCGDEQGTLYRDKLAKGEPCILRNKKWYTPRAFQKLSGKGSRSNWKKSIRCKDTTLEKLLTDGHLTCPGYNKCKAKKSTLPCSPNTVSAIPENGEEIEEEKGEEEELQASPDEEDEVELQGNDCSTPRSDTDQGDDLEEVTDERPMVGQNEFRVICEAMSGMLHESHFASGRCGNSIRTEDRLMSPVEFVEQGSAMPNALWRRDIQWEGQPLSSSLIERKMLHLHSEQCECLLCHPDPQALAGEEDDEEEEERPNLEADQAPPSTPNPASSLSQFPLLSDPLTTTSSTSHPPTTLMASTSTSIFFPSSTPSSHATRVASATSSSLSDPTTTLMTSASTSSLLPPHPATTLTAVASSVPQSVTPSSHPPTPSSSASRGGKRKRKSVRPNTDPCETARLDRLQEIRQEMEKAIERVEERKRENERDRMRERDMNDIHFSFTNYLWQFMQTLPQGKSAFAMSDIRQLMRDYEPI
ncbi:uncharacterized protein LOC132472485 isoform X2 [Gadus macrocephalus]|uniref:uncharacterized protein LOC132472485 isoform X2 n=1 Tax=Gadus macrocephalus TaxID=80720 RepID=UPI0028CB2A72|nr:uncharacterized protein LOC132472485 isoform X2 [Gadus macrocephalus]